VSNYALGLRWYCQPCRIAEQAPQLRYAPRPHPGLDAWPEGELARIRTVLRRLAVLRIENPEDAEDLVQDTLLTMAEKCCRVEIQKGLLVWAMGILRKKIGNYYRRGRRFVPLDEDSAGATDEGYGVFAAMQEALLHYAELQGMVQTALNGLGPRERTALELFLAGCPTREIADLLYPEPYQSIVNWLHRGRKKLARELARHGYR
jgi:RNA polymerase sigma factor (sigma-70 family)